MGTVGVSIVGRGECMDGGPERALGQSGLAGEQGVLGKGHGAAWGWGC